MGLVEFRHRLGSRLFILFAHAMDAYIIQSRLFIIYVQKLRDVFIIPGMWLPPFTM